MSTRRSDDWLSGVLHLVRYGVAARFAALALLVAVLGGYLLSQLFLEVNVASAKRSVQLLEIEEYLDDAAIGLGHQIQEWKDLLLRAQNAALYEKHQMGFKESSIAVQYALVKAKAHIADIGIETATIDQLIAEHKSLLTEYLQAFSALQPGDAASRARVDRKVLGVDRSLQEDIVRLKSAISEYAKQQLARAPETQGNRSLMVGLLGTVALLLMAGLGYACASCRSPS